MKRIGLIGEDPNDTSSIINLLKSKYSKGFSFIPLVKHIRGHRLDNADFPRKLQAGIESSKSKIH
jgi:hypothetical protein